MEEKPFDWTVIDRQVEDIARQMDMPYEERYLSDCTHVSMLVDFYRALRKAHKELESTP